MAENETCHRCRGRGWIECAACRGTGYDLLDGGQCEECNGEVELTCPRCEGRGVCDY